MEHEKITGELNEQAKKLKQMESRVKLLEIEAGIYRPKLKNTGSS